jgi:two-component system, NarL family, response regulator NreC
VSGNPGGGTQTFSVCIADDHSLMRQGIRLILDNTPYQVVAEAEDPVGVRHMLRRCAPDALILDLSLRDQWMLPEIPLLLEISARTRIIVLTMHDNPEYAREVLRCGASGYMCKESTAEELTAALRALFAGRKYLDARVGACLAVHRAEEQTFGLTGREREVLRLVAAGNTNREIASRLFLSLRTVEGQRSAIRMKLGLRTRAQLSEFARAHNLMS